jgi:c-di-AMP phosphodiesterase-like protein
MKFVIECANFRPRVVIIPDEDIPQIVLDTLLNISNEDGMIVLEYEQFKPGMSRAKDTTAQKLAKLLLDVHENLVHSPGSGMIMVPDWTKRATTIHHKSFNTQHLAQNCDFYFIEEDHLDANYQYIPPVHNNISELLNSYLHPSQQQNDFEDDCPDNWKEEEENLDQITPISF